MNLCCVGIDPPQAPGQLGARFDRAVEGFAGGPGDILDQMRHADGRASALDPAGKGEHLVGEVGHLPGIGLDHRENLGGSFALGSELERFDPQQDRRQHVVEIVRDTAGQAAQRLQPFRAERHRLDVRPGAKSSCDN